MKGMIKTLALQLLLMLVATYREALGLGRTYRLTTVRESLMTELKYAAALEEDGEALLSNLFRKRFAKDKVESFLKLIATVVDRGKLLDVEHDTCNWHVMQIPLY